MIPRDYASAYPFNTSGRIGVPPETHFIDPLIALSHVAAHTTTLRLGTGINLLPQSNPLLFAKQVASLDHLSKGRVLLGLGVGWLAEEFTAMGVPFAGRGRRFDDYLRAVKKVWSGVEVEHQSDYLNWSGFKSYPLPHAPSGPPIIIGGHSPAALRRTVATGDGWFAFPKSHDELSGLLGQLRDRAAAAGRDPATIEITALWRDFADGMASLKTYRDAIGTPGPGRSGRQSRTPARNSCLTIALTGRVNPLWPSPCGRRAGGRCSARPGGSGARTVPARKYAPSSPIPGPWRRPR